MMLYDKYEHYKDTFELAMVTAVSSSARHPLTVTLESASSSSWPVNKQGVASSWMLLVGLNKIFVLDPSEYCSSRESSVTHWSFNWLSSLGEDPFNNFLKSRMLISFFIRIYLVSFVGAGELSILSIAPTA